MDPGVPGYFVQGCTDTRHTLMRVRAVHHSVAKLTRCIIDPTFFFRYFSQSCIQLLSYKPHLLKTQYTPCLNIAGV